MTTITAKVIADSRAPDGSRLTTLELRYPRWIHAEGRTHRVLNWDEPEWMPERPPLPRREVRDLVADAVQRLGEEAVHKMLAETKTPSLMDDANLSRNAASGRAIPVPRMIQDILDDPAIPMYWGAHQKGMVAGGEHNAPVVIRMELQGAVQPDGKPFVIELSKTREEAWLQARDLAIVFAEAYHNAGYHKQIINRLLEPFSHINVLVSGTEWDNFFKLRIHSDAEPHIRLLAEKIRSAMQASTPKSLRPGDWHIPYVYDGSMPREIDTTTKGTNLVLAVGCAASVSYKTVDGAPMTTDAATRIYSKLTSDPLHASPFEHQACATNVKHRFNRNFNESWAQHRAMVEAGCLGEFL